LVGMVVFYPLICPFYRTPSLSAHKKGASFDAPPTKNLWFFRGFRLLDTTVQLTLQRLAQQQIAGSVGCNLVYKSHSSTKQAIEMTAPTISKYAHFRF
jgi:hypothetical protein